MVGNLASFYLVIRNYSNQRNVFFLSLSLDKLSDRFRPNLFRCLNYIISTIDDIAFELFAMHCGIGRGIRQKKIPKEK